MFTENHNLIQNIYENCEYHIYDIIETSYLTLCKNHQHVYTIIDILDNIPKFRRLCIYSFKSYEFKSYEIIQYFVNVFDELVLNIKIDKHIKNEINKVKTIKFEIYLNYDNHELIQNKYNNAIVNFTLYI